MVLLVSPDCAARLRPQDPVDGSMVITRARQPPLQFGDPRVTGAGIAVPIIVTVATRIVAVAIAIAIPVAIAAAVTVRATIAVRIIAVVGIPVWITVVPTPTTSPDIVSRAASPLLASPVP